MNKKLATRDQYLALMNQRLLEEEGQTEARFAYTPQGATAQTANGVGVVGTAQVDLLMRMRSLQSRTYSEYVVVGEGAVGANQAAPYGFPSIVGPQ